jgi:aminoglycoside phosphotransferase (APT) family kinase protein
MEVDIPPALSKLAPKLGGTSVEGIQRLSGGASMHTWAFTVVSPSGRQEMILRRRNVPFDEATSRSTSLATEAALIRGAAAVGAPVAPLVLLCEPEDGVGEAHITIRIPGEALGRKIVNDARFEAVRPKLARQCGQVAAQIHTMTGEGIPLKHANAQEELARYEEVYRASGAERPILELALQHLKKNSPPPMAPVLLHGDFRNGNIMFDPEKGVAAVLDWELSHWGDPAEDLSWICVNSWRFGRADKPVGGFGEYRDLLEGYAEAGGVEVPLSRLLYWQALGSLRWGIMCLMMYTSYATGAESSVERPMIGRRVSETEIDLINLLEAGL